ncbi:ABC transporter ATP-binding protein [Notoacmeibacter sp. MSK16QG-6]|uniref:ABC transporter ATP-binding protein n=1 Tax=Notoacmeibacter sp. MSK16QG-6 TaxID=2957982 RepID=UPI0020A22F41|nr:ABC transporter ATP-binding protein [Notoacmeibacter sp. MSK16QG-6]MCP1200662.1 ATP-binding cassette domain-containing protein [Notoacmeibacter sp. MSK16QG-6]
MSGLDVSHIHYRYSRKGRPALDDVGFSVEPGRFCALLGPNGAGKSTLFALLTRLIVAPQGSIQVAGFDLASAPRAALARIGVVFQQPTLDLDMTVRRNLTYFAGLHGLSGGSAATAIDEVLDRLAMRERAGEQVRALNGGHRRRMEIARALIHRPEVLLLDEPTVGLDAASRQSITTHVHSLAETGLAVLWATHLVDEIRPDDQVVVLHRGRVLTQGDADDVAGELTLAERFMEMTAEQDEAAA